MLKLATLLENPGEPAVESSYNDPRLLSELGYTGVVLYSTTALSGVPSPDVLEDAELRHWVSGIFEGVSSRIERCHEAGLDVYLSYDVLVLARDLVESHGRRFSVKGREHLLDASNPEAIELSVQALESVLERLPAVEGVVLRIGDNDVQRLPHLVGNDIYQGLDSQVVADTIAAIIRRFHELVVKRRNQRLIVRCWNVRPGGLHDSAELAEKVAGQLPGDSADDRLVMCFKFTQGDFRRYESWNPSSLVMGDRPVLYELQCQREYEGKGGIPNWQAPLWRDGMSEMESDDSAACFGLAEASTRVNFGGILAWVRGGGWGGPFVGREDWIDANVWAAPKLADNPQVSLDELAEGWIEERAIVKKKAPTAALRALLQQSAELARQAFYISPEIASGADGRERRGANASGGWIQDDLLDVPALWRLISKLPDSALDRVVRHKTDAANAIGELRAQLQQATDERRHAHLEDLVHTLLYTESLYESLRDLVAGFVAYRRWKSAPTPNLAAQVRKRLFDAQSHWKHHTQRYGAMSGTATAFRETGFWEITERFVGEVSSVHDAAVAG